MGDGSQRPQKWNRTPLPILGRKVPKKDPNNLQQAEKNTRRGASLLGIFRVFTQPDIVLVLLYTGIIYSMFYSVFTSTSPLLLSVYPYLTQSTVGLCFIAFGVGGAMGSVLMGRVLDYDWRQMGAKYVPEAPNPDHVEGTALHQAENGTHTGSHGRSAVEMRAQPAKPDKQDLPIEHTRLKRIPILFVIEIGACIGYGWSIQRQTHLAVPLILQFIGKDSLQFLSSCYISLTISSSF